MNTTDLKSLDKIEDKWQKALAFLRRSRWFIIFVGAPTFIALLYYGLIASDQYVSQSQFVIKNSGQRPAQVSTIANLIQSTGLSASQEEASEIVSYLHSRGALARLEKEIHFRNRFGNQSIDALDRFPQFLSDNSFEELYKYYEKMVNSYVDHENGLVILESKAFNAQDAYDINNALLIQSEDFVNKLNDRARNKALSESSAAVQLAKQRLSKARRNLREYRNTHDIIDPAKQTTGTLGIESQLVAQQAALLAQIEKIEKVAPKNPALPAMRSEVVSLNHQIMDQRGRTVGTKNGIASKLGDYEDLTTEEQFSLQMLTAASTELERARTDAIKQQYYLERVSDPNLPDKALLPSRIRQILTILALSLCLYFIGWMLVVGVLEHSSED